MVTFSRKNCPLEILKDGKRVGTICPSSTKTRKYILDLDGKFWNLRQEGPNTVGGNGVVFFLRLHEAKAAAVKYA